MQPHTGRRLCLPFLDCAPDDVVKCNGRPATGDFLEKMSLASLAPSSLLESGATFFHGTMAPSGPV